jgi:hypothetical protein
MTKRPKKTSTMRRTVVTEAQVRACVNRFLLSEVGSQFCAGEPELDVVRERWLVPILMVTPGFTAGRVGEALVQSHPREIISHTDIERMYAAADRLRKRHQAAIKTAFLRARREASGNSSRRAAIGSSPRSGRQRKAWGGA